MIAQMGGWLQIFGEIMIGSGVFGILLAFIGALRRGGIRR